MARIRTLPEVTEAGTRALVRAMGYPDAVRYIAALRPGRGDYTKERRTLLKGVTTADAIEEVLEVQERAAKRPSRKRRTA